jgi:hypothetical protein
VSIYATLWALKFPRDGDAHPGCDWVKVIVQGVPAHIGTPSPGYGYEAGDPYAEFLPSAIPVPEGDDSRVLRAVVIIREGTEKAGQRYVGPLLVLSGREYEAMSFGELHKRICDALHSPTLDQILAPIHEDFRRSGMTEEELETLLEDELAEVRKERGTTKGQAQ